MFYVNFTIIAVYTLFTFWFAVSSYRERIRRAFYLGLVATAGLIGLLTLYAWADLNGFLSTPLPQMIQAVGGVLMTVFSLLLFLPLGRNPKALQGTLGLKEDRPERFNQKDTAFNIAHVGGFGAETGKLRWALQSVDPFDGIYWTLTMALRKLADGKVKGPPRRDLTSNAVTRMVKEAARYAGADLVGITTLKPDLVYSDTFSYEDSKVGEGPAVTTPVDLKHRFVIVLGQEMRYDRIHQTLTEHNPDSLVEIGKTYYDLANIACAVAAYIRYLGYSAKAHHLRNEQIFLVPHAVDAGLGEQGRHGYLITAQFGPRVRLAAVTTDLEMILDRPVDIGVQHFCDICRLCETNCPSRAIPAERTVVRGYLKWTQDQIKCFRFGVTGGNTWGCSLCLKVCPWNKPRSFVHVISFFAASRSWIARYVLYWISVIFFGKRLRWKRMPLPDGLEMPRETTDWGK